MLYRIAIPLILFVALFSGKTVYAQDETSKISQMEDSLLITADSMYHAFIPDFRIEYTERFVKQLVQTLKQPNSWSYDFPKLKEIINITYPDDKSFRIFNWVIAPTDVTRRYYGAIQLPSEKLKLFPLIDYSSEIKKCAEDTVLTKGKWYGGLIYRIMPQTVDGETIYTVFSLNASSPLSNRKILDPMIVTDTGVIFGAEIFEYHSSCNPDKPVKRFILEYKKEVQASLNWDNEFGAIYFDRLVSQVNDPNRKYTYVPSGQYDGFKWKGDKWSFVKNLIPIDVREDGEAPVPNPKNVEKKKR